LVVVTGVDAVVGVVAGVGVVVANENLVLLTKLRHSASTSGDIFGQCSSDTEHHPPYKRLDTEKIYKLTKRCIHDLKNTIF